MFVMKAPGKINWFLSVLNRREDGYHNIRSLMQCVDLYDTLLFEEADELEVISDIQGLHIGQNLVYRAAMIMKCRIRERKGARITLRKEIPLASGMGGGSSDAAYALMGLNRLWELNLKRETLMEMGAEIGSDVPFFIGNFCSIVEGRGEVITPVTCAPSLTLLLVNPGIPVSAAWAYQALRPGLTKKSVDIKLFCQTLDRKDFDVLRPMMINDLEEAVISAYPEIGRIKNRLRDVGAEASAMSGSGSTVFGVFRSSKEAMHAAKSFGPYWHRVVSPLSNQGSNTEAN